MLKWCRKRSTEHTFCSAQKSVWPNSVWIRFRQQNLYMCKSMDPRRNPAYIYITIRYNTEHSVTILPLCEIGVCIHAGASELRSSGRRRGEGKRGNRGNRGNRRRGGWEKRAGDTLINQQGMMNLHHTVYPFRCVANGFGVRQSALPLRGYWTRWAGELKCLRAGAMGTWMDVRARIDEWMDIWVRYELGGGDGFSSRLFFYVPCFSSGECWGLISSNLYLAWFLLFFPTFFFPLIFFPLSSFFLSLGEQFFRVTLPFLVWY